ncbi:MAG: DUF1353 domain-containing protein [Pseudomonadota bacterium]
MTYTPISPLIANPYPDRWTSVSDLRFETPLLLARAEKAIPMAGSREAQYIVAAPYTVSYLLDEQAPRQRLTVPAGMLTDLASVPAVARWFVGRVGPHLEAAILHDYLFVAWQDLEGHGARSRDFAFANALMMAAMKAAGVQPMHRRIIHLAVSSPIGRLVYWKQNPPPRFVTLPADLGRQLG